MSRGIWPVNYMLPTPSHAKLEIRGLIDFANIYFCSQGEEDETAIDVNFSGNLAVENIFLRYIPDYHSLMPLKLGVLHGETKILGPLSRP